MKTHSLKKWPVIFLVCLFHFNSFSQNFKTRYFNPSDSSKNYFVVYDTPKNIKGVLVLLPSFGEPAWAIKNETDIIKSAINHDLFTVSITLQDGPFSFYVDSTSQSTLSFMIKKIYEEYKLKGKKLYLGGFSIGGSGVIRYYEKSLNEKSECIPTAVFAIDPPLDFIRLYNSSKRTLLSNPQSEEASYFVQRIEYEFKGSPEKNYANYLANSPYVFNDSNSVISTLKNSPILLITEPDIDWQLNNRNRDYYDINAFDCAAVIRALRILGNVKATLLTTTNKGYRKINNNSRNPHSWSIADPENTIKWILQY